MYASHEERVGRIKLLYLSLIDNWIRLEEAVQPFGRHGEQVPLANLELEPIRANLGEIQSLCPELLVPLMFVLRECDGIQARLDQVAVITHEPFNQQAALVRPYKDDIRSDMHLLRGRFDWLLKQLMERFQFEPVYLDGINLVKIPPIPDYWPR